MVSSSEHRQLGFAEWLQSPGKDYVAHTIHPDTDVQSIFQDGHLRSAEEILRLTGKVSFEKGPLTDRGEVTLPKLTLDEISVLTELEKEVKITIALSSSPPIISENPWERIRALNAEIERQKASAVDWNSSDLGPLLIEKKEEKPLKIKFFIEGDYFHEVAWRGTKLDSCYGTLRIRIALENAQDTRTPTVDEKIAKIYNKFKNNVNVRESQLYEACSEIRKHFYDNYKLNAEIRTVRNTINRLYGSIAILIGNAENVVGHTSNNGEVYLKKPFQNHGKPFHIDLSDKDVMVVGRKEKLKPHSKILKEKNIRYTYIEDLTDEQKKRIGYNSF